MHRKKILFVTEYFPPAIFGGGEISAALLVKSLSKEFETYVLTCTIEGAPEHENLNGAHIYRRLKTGKNPSNFFSNVRRAFFFNKSVKNEAARLDSEFNFDIVHCLNNSGTIGINESGIKARRFATVNSYLNFCPKANFWYKEKKTCTGCNPKKFIACMMHSEYVGKQRIGPLLKYNPVFLAYLYTSYKTRMASLKDYNLMCVNDEIKDYATKHKLCLRAEKIPTVFSPQEEKEEISHDSRMKERKMITFIGTLEKIKGADLAIKAFSRLSDRKDKLLVIAGDGSQADKLRDLAVDLHVGDEVLFLGNIPYKRMTHLYELSSLILLPARWPEPFSRVLLEALYHGKPIVATNVGGNPECILDGKNGFLTKEDEKDIALRIDEIFTENNISKFGVYSTKIFNDKFAKDKVIRKIIETYEQISL